MRNLLLNRSSTIAFLAHVLFFSKPAAAWYQAISSDGTSDIRIKVTPHTDNTCFKRNPNKEAILGILNVAGSKQLKAMAFWDTSGCNKPKAEQFSLFVHWYDLPVGIQILDLGIPGLEHGWRSSRGIDPYDAHWVDYKNPQGRRYLPNEDGITAIGRFYWAMMQSVPPGGIRFRIVDTDEWITILNVIYIPKRIDGGPLVPDKSLGLFESEYAQAELKTQMLAYFKATGGVAYHNVDSQLSRLRAQYRLESLDIPRLDGARPERPEKRVVRKLLQAYIENPLNTEGWFIPPGGQRKHPNLQAYPNPRDRLDLDPRVKAIWDSVPRLRHMTSRLQSQQDVGYTQPSSGAVQGPNLVSKPNPSESIPNSNTATSQEPFLTPVSQQTLPPKLATLTEARQILQDKLKNILWKNDLEVGDQIFNNQALRLVMSGYPALISPPIDGPVLNSEERREGWEGNYGLAEAGAAFADSLAGRQSEWEFPRFLQLGLTIEEAEAIKVAEEARLAEEYVAENIPPSPVEEPVELDEFLGHYLDELPPPLEKPESYNWEFDLLWDIEMEKALREAKDKERIEAGAKKFLMEIENDEPSPEEFKRQMEQAIVQMSDEFGILEMLRKELGPVDRGMIVEADSFLEEL
ncbi:hypothetical protein TWF694_003613 [Orbilia ellipsospora]|uniref:Uncharacterized protein n=1 Tax=Orbilia ellipsospora TaxID=2528407 RepID=A0AAV9WYR4_9PEZI